MPSSIGAAKYGMLDLAQPAAPAAPAASNGAVTTGDRITGSSGWREVLSPSTAEMWVIGIGAVMLGLIAVSTSVRIGKFRAELGAGDA